MREVIMKGWFGRFFHKIEMDDRLTPRHGIIIEKFGKRTVAVHLILNKIGRSKTLFFIDFRRGVALTKPLYWIRLCYRTPAWWNVLDGMAYPRWWRRIECCWGVEPVPGYKPTGRKAELFE